MLTLFSDFVEIPQLMVEEILFEILPLLSRDRPRFHSEQKVADFFHAESLVIPVDYSIGHDERESLESEKKMVWWVE
jgi:hypothetical protein